MRKVFNTLLLSIFLCVISFGLTGCSDPVLTLVYVMDNEELDAAPDKNFYDVVSVECSNPDIITEWNPDTWSLVTTEYKKDTTVTVTFAYTSSPFKIDGVGYASLQDAFNAVPTNKPTSIQTTADFDGHAVLESGKEVTLELNSFTLDGIGSDTVCNNGTLIINGEGQITNSVIGEYSKSLINYGSLTVNNITITNDTNNVAIWNSNNGSSVMTLTDCTLYGEKPEVISIINSGEMNIVGGTYQGNGDLTHPVIYNNTEIAILSLNGPAIINNNEGYTIFRGDGTVNTNGTVYENTYQVE